MPRREESALQEWFVMILRYNRILFCASTGGERAGVIQGSINKRRGYQKGCPDIIIFEPRGKYHGLTIELKAGAKVTPEQKKWRDELSQRGYKALIMPRNMNFRERQDYLENELMEYLNQ